MAADLNIILERARRAGVEVRDRDGDIYIWPKGTPLADDLRAFRSEVESRLPGPCDRCGEWVARRIPAYWGPHLCPDCCGLVAAEHDERDSWPPVPWET